MVGMIAGIAVAHRGEPRTSTPAAVSEKPEKSGPATRESVAMKLLATGKSSDWLTASDDSRVIVAMYFTARYTPIDEPVLSLARATTLLDYLNKSAQRELSHKEDSPIVEQLAIFQAMNDTFRKHNAGK